MFVSHNLQAIATLCDRVVLLRPNQDPKIGEVADVLADYVSSKGTSADPRATVRRARLVDTSTGVELRAPVPPGASLALEVELLAAAALERCGVLIQVVRSDGLVVFTGMSTLDGLPDFDLKPGECLRAQIRFFANVLRGTYVINLQLVDTLRQWPPAVISSVASFVVTESTRAAGCADLFPSYAIAVMPQELEAANESLTR